MSTNICSKSRAKYSTIKQFAEQYAMSLPHAYRILSLPVFQEAIIKTGTRSKKVNSDKAFEIMQQYFR